eukprot:16706_1
MSFVALVFLVQILLALSKPIFTNMTDIIYLQRMNNYESYNVWRRWTECSITKYVQSNLTSKEYYWLSVHGSLNGQLTFVGPYQIMSDIYDININEYNDNNDLNLPFIISNDTYIFEQFTP